MKAGQWSAFLVGFLDLLALSALALTGDVRLELFAAALVFFAAGLALRRSVIPIGILGGMFVPILAGTVLLWRGGWMPPVVAAAHGAPLAHALLWLAPKTPVYRGWRMGLSFIELILASGITAEAYLPMMIILFVVLASVALSCDFLDRELSDSTLAAGFIRNSVLLSFAIFLTSAIIFPILPRPRAMPLNVGGTSVGYTETVNLSQWSQLNSDSGGAVQLRIYPPEETDLTFEIYLGLLRGKVLDIFDGQEWYSSPRSRKTSFPVRAAAPVDAGKNTVRAEIVRESMEPATLPAPYGTHRVWTESGEHSRDAIRSRSGDWFLGGAGGRRVRYFAEWVANDLTHLRNEAELDAPTEIHRAIPDTLRTARLASLARRVFSGATSARDKVQRIRTFFSEDGFVATGAQANNLESEAIERQLKRTALSPLEQFLFVTKQGHCEWFATASAILLRHADVPTRLVAGFRLSRSQLGGVLTVRSGDAHAWLEAFVPGQGWVPIDPTPRLTRGSSYTDALRRISDLFSAYWYKYVISFGESANGKISGSLVHQALPILGWGAGALAFIGAALWGLRFIRGLTWSRLAWERRRMARILSLRDLDSRENPERWMRLVQARFGAEAASALSLWHAKYLELRFGAGCGDRAIQRSGIRELKLLSGKIRRT